MKSLMVFCVGVAATLAWQSYGDMARQDIANSYPQLAWLAPEAAVAQTVSDSIAPAIASLDQQELKAMSLDLATLHQKIDQIAAGQEQMAHDFTMELRAVEQGILDKISAPPQPVGAPLRKPAPTQVAPLR